MVITNAVKLPSDEELTVEEANVSHSTLRAASPYIGQYCEGVNNEFMLCRFEQPDPRPCVALGKEVTACTLELFRKIKAKCKDEFNQYAKCIDKSSGDFSFVPCRKTQFTFDDCMKKAFGMERPEFGYFCRARIHTSPSTQPEPAPEPVFPDPTPTLPEDACKEPPRMGGRWYFFNE